MLEIALIIRIFSLGCIVGIAIGAGIVFAVQKKPADGLSRKEQAAVEAIESCERFNKALNDLRRRREDGPHAL